ncbi:MAG: hypothetical protein AAFX90_12535 [Pseudomonadota bacterium]
MPNTAIIQRDAVADDNRAARDRVNYFASVIGRNAPAKLLDDDGAPSFELRVFCVDTGMSLDWVFLGDLRAMVLASHRDRQSKRHERR